MSETAFATSTVTVPGLRVRHQSTGAEDASQTTDLAHHVWGSDDRVEVQIALRDLVDQLVRADLVGAGGLSGLGPLAGGKDQHARRLAGAVRQIHSAANHLIRFAGVDTEAHRNVDSLVEMCSGVGLGKLHGLGWCVQLGVVDFLSDRPI
jgi:hypothetical protein